MSWMAKRTLQLYGTASATTTSLAQITIPTKGTLNGLQFHLLLDSITDNGIVRCEISKVPTNQIATNGALDPFFEIGAYSNFVTSGLSQGGQCGFVPLSVPVRQGEIIYLHCTVAGTATFYFNGIFWYA
jgi:hypothetical protein